VRLRGKEAAFDLIYEDQLNLYEMIVANEMRNQGVGTSIVRFGVALAEELGKPCLSIRAGQIGEQTIEEVREFYIGLGMVQRDEDDPDLFVLRVQRNPA
jgi:hypothetical protein